MNESIGFYVEQLNLLNQIGVALSAERNTDVLLEKILLGAKQLTNADGGTIYLVNDKQLVMKIVHTDSLDYAMGGSTGNPIRFSPLELYLEDGGINTNTVVSNVYHSGVTINIPDAYQSKEYDFSGTFQFDELTGYKSISFLTVPLRNHEDDIIGILQLINPLDKDTNKISMFSPQQQELVESLSSQAATALTNRNLIDDMKLLFDSIVKMLADTIDEKSAHTGNHCRQIPVLTDMIARSINASRHPYFKRHKFSDDDLYELEVASWLHDCGKLTTPDKILEKGTKLEQPHDRIENVRLRMELIKRDEQLKHGPGDVLTESLQAIEKDMSFLEALNKGTEFVSDEAIAHLAVINEKYSYVLAGKEYPVLDEDEMHHLSIRKGTISEHERGLINNHINVTIHMLESLPFPKHLKNVPEYAGGHHERIDGRGFPKGLQRDDMSVAARVMAVADIFEALTASDRPYKAPLKLSKVMDIMEGMSKTGHIDPDIYDVFVEQGVHIHYAKEFLRPEQLDI